MPALRAVLKRAARPRVLRNVPLLAVRLPALRNVPLRVHRSVPLPVRRVAKLPVIRGALLPAIRAAKRLVIPGCAAPCDDACVETACCPVTDACEIAELIYESQTACYAKDRRRAIQKLGNRYTCVCNPEIMAAFIYALNDADERVRKEAADEIGDQLRKYPCCCSPCVVQALTCALADCDRGVRRQAEEALEACGYEIVDGCCEVACDTTCAPGCAPSCAPAAAPAHPAPATPEAVPPMDGAAPAPAPAPPEEPKAYFPQASAAAAGSSDLFLQEPALPSVQPRRLR